MSQSISDFGISIPAGIIGETRALCPKCSHDRRKNNVKCLVVNASEGMWFCHHCGWKGSTKGHDWDTITEHFNRPRFVKTELPKNIVGWFDTRRITVDVLNDEGISFKNGAIEFPYYKDCEVVNIKHRTLDKKFWQEKGAEKCFYRHDELTKLKSDMMIITEGEVDAISFLIAKFSMVTSVPDGAPSADSKEFNSKFEFLDRSQDLIDAYNKILIAVDSDGPGRRLEQELVRRIGAEKCLKIAWPEGCKDANDVLVRHGWEYLRKLALEAKPYPVEGLFSCFDFSREVECLYDSGEKRGLTTGIKSLDGLYTVRPSELTVITGIPSHGKSNFMDCIAVFMARLHGWKFLFFSPENWPVERHIQSLLEKSLEKPFDKPGRSEERMTKSEMFDGMKWINQYFHFLYPEAGTFSVDTILKKARAAVFRHGINGIVIDPWNELEHEMGNLTEAQYLSRELSKLRQFSRRNGVHVWIIAHPRNLQKDKSGKYQPPTLYEISGGAHWRNKADNGICVFRENFTSDVSKIIVQKIRFKETGQVGEVSVNYNYDDGNYF